MIRRKFGDALTTFTLSKRHVLHPHYTFEPLPPPTGEAPYRLKLEDVLPQDRLDTVRSAGKLVFHTTGNTGGVQSGKAQYIVAQHMEKDVNSSQGSDRPAFFYHLGNVVYYYGETEQYYPQFYKPYKGYDVPIFAIPGNSDGSVLNSQIPSLDSLDAFTRNFCSPRPEILPEAEDVLRHAMTQPNVYWTLDAPYVTIIGLYTNVPEGGMLDQDQIDWFVSEMRAADQGKALIVAMHHPAYSGDKWYSGSVYMCEILDKAIRESERLPDMVLAAHVHNYQRFNRYYRVSGQEFQIPYIVAGAGGYFHLHHEQMLEGKMVDFGHHFAHEGVTLERYCDDRHGFLRLEVTPNEIKGTYLVTPRPHEGWRNPAVAFDTFVKQVQHVRIPAGAAE